MLASKVAALDLADSVARAGLAAVARDAR
jgi:hypothetical protein